MTAPKVNPFPGLRSFNYEESHLFFGREQHIKDLLKKLNTNHFVAIVGTSGSGKSSLVRAGLLPAIEKQGGPDDSTWCITTMKPGNTPLRNMAASVLQALSGNNGDDEGAVSKLTDTLEASSLGLVQAVRGLLPEKKSLLILLDQFEETFRFSGTGMEVNDEQSEKFVRLIIDAIRQRDVPIYVILTIRSDFLGDCARFEGLPEAINDGHYLVPRLNGEQNKQAITGPVDYADGKISPRLVQRLINDLGDNPDQLPVLQHALMRTWDKWLESSEPGEPMDIRHYEMTGTMDHALSRHADEAYKELKNDKQRDLLKHIFKAITVKSGENRGVRRPTSVKNLSLITGASSTEVINALAPFRKHGRSFILPDEHGTIKEETMIDISHESLMRAWVRLKEWVEEESESADLYERLCQSAILQKEGKAALWRDPELQAGLDWQKREQPGKAWAAQYNDHFDLAMTFLDESKHERDRERNAANRRRRIIQTAVAVFIVVISSLTIWALIQTKKANENYEEAQAQTQEALNQKQLAEKSEAMALEASKNALDAKEFAELQSNIAQEQKKLAEEQKKRAESAAYTAQVQEKYAIEQKEIAEQKSNEALMAKQRAEASQNEAQRLRMLELSQNLAFKSLQISEDKQLKSLLAYEAYMLSKNNGGQLNNQQLYAASYDATKAIDPSYKDIEFRATNGIEALKTNESELVLVTSDGQISKYGISGSDNKSPKVLGGMGSDLNTAYFSDNGMYAVGGTEDNRTVIYRVSDGKSFKLSGHSGLLRAVAVSDNDALIVTGARDSSIIVYNDTKQVAKQKFGSRIKALEFINSSNDLLIGCDDGDVFLMKGAEGAPQRFATGPGARVQSMSSLRSAGRVIVGYSNGAVQVFDMKGKLIRRLDESASVDHIASDENKGIVVVATARPRIKIYHIDNLQQKPIEITSLNSPVTAMDIREPYVYITCKDKSVRKYPLNTVYFERVLEGKIAREFTKDEWETYIGSDVPYELSSSKRFR
jgi:energy-coupling factor transporter ATP-binding protein EcfA2